MKRTKKYEHIARKFRNTIEKLLKKNLIKDIILNNFPFGCCSDASLLLAELFYRNNISCKYVSGIYYCDNKAYTHAWLVVEGDIIVDITGDQFIDNKRLLNYNQKVYIGKLDKLHELFINEDIIIQDFFGIEKYDSNLKYRLEEIYNKIIEYFE